METLSAATTHEGDVTRHGELGERVSEGADPSSRQRSRRGVRVLAFALLTGAYLALGAWLAIDSGVIMGDALARVANADYVLTSRDPHLAAIGFVWSPLPTLLAIPVLAFKPLWPALGVFGVAGIVVSAASMAGAVLQLDAIARDLRAPRVGRRIVVALFALHPMVVFYGANGMSESLFLLFLLVTIRRLMRWLDTGEVGALVGTAIALAGAYLTRYEAAPIAVAVSILVLGVSVRRTFGSPRVRLRVGFADLMVVAFPFVAVFFLWAVLSWIIVGSPFEQFTSTYGNTSTVDASTGSEGGGSPLGLVARQLFVLEPLGAVLVLVAVWRAFERRDPRVFAAVVVFGSALGFSVMAAMSGATFGFLRFYLVLVPLTALAALSLLAGARRATWARPIPTFGAARVVFVGIALAVAIPVSAAAFTSRELAPQELMVAAALDSTVRARHPGLVPAFETERQIAEFLDRQGLPPGSVLVDVLSGFPIVVSSEHPEMFVIPSDADFMEHLAAPEDLGVRYLLVLPDRERGTSDVLNRTYPGLYENGAGVGVLAGEFTNLNPNALPWRLYQVVGEG